MRNSIIHLVLYDCQGLGINVGPTTLVLFLIRILIRVRKIVLYLGGEMISVKLAIKICRFKGYRPASRIVVLLVMFIMLLR